MPLQSSQPRPLKYGSSPIFVCSPTVFRNGAASGEALQYASPGTSADEPAVLVLSWSWGEPRFDRSLEFHFHPADGTVAWRIVAGPGPSGLQHVEPDIVDEALVRDAVQRLVAFEPA